MTVRLAVCLIVVLGCGAKFCSPIIAGEDLPPGFQQHIFEDPLGTHRYAVFVPPGPPPQEGWPVVLFLHGAGERGSDGVLQLSVGLGTALEAAPSVGFIAVFPQAEDTEERYLTGWSVGTRDSERALQILDLIERKYPIDSRRRVLCGWSMGGYGAWSWAATEPNRWAAMMAISGGAVDDVSLECLAAAGIPVWAIHGTEDTLIPFEESEGLIETLNETGGKGKLTLVSGAGHDVWRNVFAERDILDWLRDPRSGDPPGVRFESVTPLPARSRFYVEHFAHRNVIPGAIGLRIGNRALSGISRGLPDLIPPDALTGGLEDVQRTLLGGDNPVVVTLSDLTWDCTLKHVNLRAVSGGRFRVRFGLSPITLTIGATSLRSRDHQAGTDAVRVVIGHRRPTPLEVEFQPRVEQGRLRLVPAPRAIPDCRGQLVHSCSPIESRWRVPRSRRITYGRGSSGVCTVPGKNWNPRCSASFRA